MRGPLSPSAGRRRTPLGAMRVPGGPSPLSAGRLLPPPSLLKCILIKVDAGLPSSCGNTPLRMDVDTRVEFGDDGVRCRTVVEWERRVGYGGCLYDRTRE